MKKFVLTLSTGRCGTQKFSSILRGVPNSYVEHEGDPGFETCRVENISNPAVGASFVSKKINFYKEQNKDYVFHTGHICGLGFIGHFIDCGVIPDITILTRPRREVATSMFRLSWIPGRRKFLIPWYSTPDDPNVLSYPNWQKAHSYQLCYWWVLESERRIKAQVESLRPLGSKVWNTTLNQMMDFNHINSMLEFYGIDSVNDKTPYVLGRDKDDVVNDYAYYERDLQNKIQVPPAELLDRLEGEVCGAVAYS